MITYYNVVRHTDIHNRPIETWGVFKRNASSYVLDLSTAKDTSKWRYDLRAAKDFPQTEHDFNNWIPSEQTLKNYEFSQDLNPSNVKICIRDPLHRYCSGLVMLNFNIEEPYSRHSLMEPYYHNGGREEIINMFPDVTGEGHIRFCYSFRQFVRSIQNTFFSAGNTTPPEYTFGESHLDPALTLACLLPYMHDEANIRFIDLRKWTEYTTGILGIEETLPQVHRWNAPKLQNRRDQIAQPGFSYFKVLQHEMRHFTKDARAYETTNWQPTFEDWLEPEVRMYKFFKENPIIASGSESMEKLTDLLVEMLDDPYFLYRSFIVRKNYTNEQVLERFPKRLRFAVQKCISKYIQWEKEVSSRRVDKHQPKGSGEPADL